MNKLSRPSGVKEYKIQASILFKSLHSANDEISQKAAKRFQRLPAFKSFSLNEIIKKELPHKSD